MNEKIVVDIPLGTQAGLESMNGTGGVFARIAPVAHCGAIESLRFQPDGHGGGITVIDYCKGPGTCGNFETAFYDPLSPNASFLQCKYRTALRKCGFNLGRNGQRGDYEELEGAREVAATNAGDDEKCTLCVPDLIIETLRRAALETASSAAVLEGTRVVGGNGAKVGSEVRISVANGAQTSSYSPEKSVPTGLFMTLGAFGGEGRD